MLCAPTVYSHVFITSVPDTVNNYTLSNAPLKCDPFNLVILSFI